MGVFRGKKTESCDRKNNAAKILDMNMEEGYCHLETSASFNFNHIWSLPLPASSYKTEATAPSFPSSKPNCFVSKTFEHLLNKTFWTQQITVFPPSFFDLSIKN